ncbi:hypothetical protein J437_LFUL003531 [Ladona fulva]|uniref:Uncharacterized protein n=1 Tax=Ladona fulva TaxID=123851 RepID=A0A8K0JUH8_LADFU|nr:hypothetical protein J437_LFUL003531 [Ladona fulva]
MPGITLLGRRWQAASDDFVIPASIDAIFRATLVLICYVIYRLYPSWDCFDQDVADDETWSGRNGIRALLALCSILLLSEVIAAVLLAGESSKGGIMDVHARRFVSPLLAFR